MQPGNKFHGLQYSVSSSLVIPVYVPSPQQKNEFFRERVLFHFLISQSFLFISAQQMFSWLLNLWQDQVYAPVLQFFSFFLIFKKFIFKLQFTFIFFPILQLFYCCSITVVCISPHLSTLPQPNPPPSPASLYSCI